MKPLRIDDSNYILPIMHNICMIDVNSTPPPFINVANRLNNLLIRSMVNWSDFLCRGVRKRCDRGDFVFVNNYIVY